LERFKVTPDYHKDYGAEELTAEIGSAMLCQHFKISCLKQSAAYVGSWLNAIQGDKTLLFRACSRAEKAINYLKLFERVKTDKIYLEKVEEII